MYRYMYMACGSKHLYTHMYVLRMEGAIRVGQDIYMRRMLRNICREL